jgi:putative pyruvate formate lyase activating enzyme
MWRVLRTDAVAVLKDKNAQASLPRYFAVMRDEKTAKFLIAKKLPADFNENDSLPKLWLIHEKLTEEFVHLQEEIDRGEKNLTDLESPQKSYLNLKIEMANRILEHCHFCTRRCGINRLDGGLGYCRCGSQISVSSMCEHMGEEPELVPSATIFTMGCTIRCLHCQNWTISQWFETGETYSPERLAAAIERLQEH